MHLDKPACDNMNAPWLKMCAVIACLLLYANHSPATEVADQTKLQQDFDHKLGEAFFKRVWVSSPASTQAVDGLGPLYNARACHQCHQPNIEPQIILRLTPSDPIYGAQIQTRAIQGHEPEAKLIRNNETHTVEIADGKAITLNKPVYQLDPLNYGDLHEKTRLSPRATPSVYGLGLLAAIAEGDILRQHDPNDANHDGISGRANLIWSDHLNKQVIGRFGWQADSATLLEQVEKALFLDLGLSVTLHPYGEGECTTKQTHCIKAPNGNSPQHDDLEVPRHVSNSIARYLASIPPPSAHTQINDSAKQGEAIFNRLGCVSCHTPSYSVCDQRIWPYSDLLLHDMGESLADYYPDGTTVNTEWRTAPLWGIGAKEKYYTNTRYLHDARAASLIEAILWHDGEARAARDAFINSSKTEQQALLDFLHSL